MTDDFLLRLYKCLQFAAECASARNKTRWPVRCGFNAVDVG
jgi:hypothetical protein